MISTHLPHLFFDCQRFIYALQRLQYINLIGDCDRNLHHENECNPHRVHDYGHHYDLLHYSKFLLLAFAS